jgi:hypothetical protein
MDLLLQLARQLHDSIYASSIWSAVVEYAGEVSCHHEHVSSPTRHPAFSIICMQRSVP